MAKAITPKSANLTKQLEIFRLSDERAERVCGTADVGCGFTGVAVVTFAFTGGR
jgi:hypothetical protein